MSGETNTTASLKEAIPSGFNCPDGDIFSLPTKADLINTFNEIASIPGKLQAKVLEMKAEKEKEIAELTEKMKTIDDPDELKKIQEEIKAKENYIENVLFGEIKEKIDETIADIEAFIEDLADILSPFWQKGSVRNWQKEARDAFTELLQEFHTYIPTKIAEFVSKLVPFNFTISIMGLSINILKLVTSPSYKNELIDQISGKNYLTQIIAKKKQLADLQEQQKSTPDDKELQEKIDTLKKEIEDLEKKREEWVDKFFKMIPEELRQFDGEFGVIDTEAKAKLVWKYIKTEIKEWIQNAHMKAFEKLISIFKEIWDLLGLPGIPIGELLSIMSLDIGALIEARIASIKAKFQASKAGQLAKIKQINKQIEELKKKLDDKDISMDDHVKFSEELDKLEEEKRLLEEDLLKEVNEFHTSVRDSIEGISIFGFNLRKIIGDKIESTAASIEEEIADFALELKDFKANWHKKILFSWVKIVKKFFNAIGLGKIFKPLFLTFCDILKLLGMKFDINVKMPDIEGVIESTKKDVKTVQGLFSKESFKNDDSDVNTFDAIDGEDTYAAPTTGGSLYVFVDGVKQNFGVGGLGQVYMSGNSVVFRNPPAQGAFISIFRH
tara:strand:+ start:482 stop:2314 length:1833 start_codon:yes stop_codon:yes gene_type:complete